MKEYPSHQDVVNFWFNELRPAEWFRINQQLDQKIINKYTDLVDHALHGNLIDWSHKPSSALALLLVFDQFPRHIWRGQSKAFIGDSWALEISLEAEKQGWIQEEPIRAKRQFWLMPRLHSEKLDVHLHALPLFERWTDTRTVALAKRYGKLIASHGHFPHRDRSRLNNRSSY